jgi:hypothetical protein
LNQRAGTDSEDDAELAFGTRFEFMKPEVKPKKSRRDVQAEFREFVESEGYVPLLAVELSELSLLCLSIKVPPMQSDVQARISDWVRQEVLSRVLLRQQEVLRFQADQTRASAQREAASMQKANDYDVEELIEASEAVGKNLVQDVVNAEAQKVALEVMKQVLEEKKKVDAEQHAIFIKQRQIDEDNARRLKELEEAEKRAMEHEERKLLIMEIKKLREAQEARAQYEAEKLKAEDEARKRLEAERAEKERLRVEALKAAEEEAKRLQKEKEERERMEAELAEKRRLEQLAARLKEEEERLRKLREEEEARTRKQEEDAKRKLEEAREEKIASQAKEPERRVEVGINVDICIVLFITVVYYSLPTFRYKPTRQYQNSQH